MVFILSTLNATTVLYQSYNDLVNKADGVVSGVVSKIDYRRNKNGDIFTYVTLKKVTVHNASYDKNDYTFRIKGGVIDGEYLEVEGAPKFYQDEEVILFIKDNGKLIVPIVGWEQGMFKVKKNEALEDYITDANENIIYDIDEKGTVYKERKNKSKLHILNQKGNLMTKQLSDFEKNIIIDDDLAEKDKIKLYNKSMKAMKKESFLKKLKKNNKNTKIIRSITPDNESFGTILDKDSPSSKHTNSTALKSNQETPMVDQLPKNYKDEKNEIKY